ncbi:MAG: caspase family protein [Clostridia bacterium]|nr:caspase family protein [Clostridia bacterium]
MTLLRLAFFPAVPLAEDGAGVCRALLIACDTFVSALSIAPAGKHNLEMMETVLSLDAREFSIKRQYGITSSAEALEFAINSAFADAREGDVSLLYISTHGEFDPSYNNPQGYLLLSDGSLEGRVSAQQLNAYLDRIPGTKALVVDACNSGALIGKGISPDAGSARVARLFQSDDYKVLTSSGASEPSWFWKQSLSQAPPGSSFFTAALVMGAGYLGGFGADENRDGVITLDEMYRYLRTNQASSAAQIYPQDDDFPLIVYDRALLSQEDTRGELYGFSFESTALDAARPLLTFDFTVKRPTRAIYQITPLDGEVWDWRNSISFPDTSEFDGDADPMGDVSPGRKQVSIDIADALPDGWTYAMLHVLTQGRPQENREPFVYASRVLSAKQPGGDPELDIRAAETWQRKYQREMEIFIGHALPCNLTVSVCDEDGNTIRRLWSSKATRPQALSPEGSLLYWNGLDDAGGPVDQGRYRIVAAARIGGEGYQTDRWVQVE